MAQKERRLIVISKDNYEELRRRGFVTDSFDSVITILLEQTKSQILKQQKQQQEGVKAS
jgi:predicted CopG family antitoxin